MERFKVGLIYKTRCGGKFYVVGEHTKYKGYETVYNQYGKNRYNRSTENTDNGRTTGRDWTEDCLVYPPVVVGTLNPVSVRLLRIISKLFSNYRDIKFKIKMKLNMF